VIGPELIRGLLVTAGLLSLGVSAALMLRQRDLKRMLAYSSVEHMGLLALAAAIGGTLAISAALLHILGHGLAKASAFVVSGRVLAAEGTTAIAGLASLSVRRPVLAVPFAAAMAALLGLPPFSLFFSEVAIVVAGFRAGLGWVVGAAVALLVVLFAALARHVCAIMFGPITTDESAAVTSPPPRPADRSPHGPWLPLAIALGATAVVGFTGGSFASLLTQAANVLGAA
jgi:formate hydrogenlyase subunit 3/multisubunit Na+/H+ antiporter MnhD subunit